MTKSYEILPSSPKLLGKGNNLNKHNFPWEALSIGHSFKVPHVEIKLGTLRSLASQAGRKLNRKFKVIDHSELNTYECGRLDDPPEPKKMSPEEEAVYRKRLEDGSPPWVHDDVKTAMKANEEVKKVDFGFGDSE